MDPQQRLLLETSWEALEDAGIVPSALAGSSTGVFVGHLASDYWEMLLNAKDVDIYSLLGSAARGVLAGRISHALDLRGPSVSVDTGCSASLVAVHLGCQSLRLGESRVALAAGVNVILAPEPGIIYSQASMLAPDGRCKFGDAQADGFVRSEGVGVVVLKTLPDAVADGDPVRAVILGSATNNNGQASGYLMAPAQSTQEELLVTACEKAGIDPATVDYLEAHGTGTRIGDPMEIGAATRVLGRGRPANRPLLISSVKTNIGHCEAASGMAGLIKTALCLQHRTVPATLHVDTLNPKIEWEASPVTLCREPTPLPDRGRPVVAGVNALGIGGTNAHVVISEHVQARDAPAVDPAAGDRTPYLLPISAKDAETLGTQSARYADWLRDADTNGVGLGDICRSAGERREHHEYRLAVVGASAAEMADSLAEFTDAGSPPAGLGQALAGTAPRLAFVFPGQGSQWIGMGRELLTASPAFAAELRACDAAIQRAADWSLLHKLSSDELGREGLHVVQPVIWAIEVSLAALWKSWGVEPDWVIGHSMGEIAAAYVGGALTLDDAAEVICQRSVLAEALPGDAGMASIGLGEEDTQAEIDGYSGRVVIAAVNGPRSTVIAGDRRALHAIAESLTRRGVLAQRINVDFASHSPHVDPILNELQARLAPIRPRAGHTPMYSTLLNRPVDGTTLDAGYWGRNLREKVRFAQAITDLAQVDTIFMEISPHPILLSAMRECLHGVGRGLALGSLRRDEPERATLLATAARLYAAGRPLRWRELNGSGTGFVRLPTYPWRRDHFWFDERPADEPAARETRTPPDTIARSHPLIGTRAPGDLGTGHAEWENELDLTANSYLIDHRVQGVSVLPGTVAVEIALAVAAEMFPGREVRVRDTRYHSPLLLGDRKHRLRVTVSAAGESSWRMDVSARTDVDDDWTSWATTSLDPASGTPHVASAGTAPAVLDSIRKRCPEHVDREEFYRRLALSGNECSGSLRSVQRIWCGDGEALATVEAPAAVAATLGEHQFHPALLEACAQTLAATFAGRADASAFVLGGIDDARVYRSPGTEVSGHAVLRAGPDANSLAGDVRVYDESGELIAELLGLRLRHLGARQRATCEEPIRVPAEDWIYKLEWRASAVPPPGSPATGRWLLLADRIGVALGLSSRLRNAGLPVTLVVPGSEFAQLGPDCFQVQTDSERDFSRILRETLSASAADAQWAAVVHLWNLNVPAAPLIAGSAIGNADAEGFRSLIRLVQALSHASLPVAPTLRVVTRGALAITEHDSISPLQAPAWGLGRAIALEHPELACALIDLDPSMADAGGLFAELVADDGETEVALRGSARYAARLVRAPRRHTTSAVASGAVAGQAMAAVPAPNADEVTIRLARTTQRPAHDGDASGSGWEHRGTIAAVGTAIEDYAIGDEVSVLAAPRRESIGASALKTRVRSDATYLITGGLGDLGQRVAEWLADRGARNLLLVGRSAPLERLRSVQALLGPRVQVHCETCDVADGDKLARLISAYEASGAPAIAGVVHAAGVARFEPIAEIDDLGLDEVLRPKVAGAWNLHQILGGRPLDFFVLFSSASSIVGSPQFGSYAAANAFLDSLAAYRCRAGQATMCVNWGFWEALGVPTRPGLHSGRPLAPDGVRQFTPQEGLAILDELLYGNVEHAIVMPVDWAAWRAAYPAIAKSPVFAEILTGGPAAAVAVSAAAVAVSAAAGIPGSAARPGPTRRDEIETTVKDCVARVLRLPSSQVPSHKRLNSLGLDSLMAAEIRHLLQGDFGLTVPLVRLLGSSTVDDVVTALTEPEPEARTAQYYPERTRGDSGTSAADVGGDGHLSFLARCRRVPLTPENDK